jgi:hypothetical protein
MQPITTDTVGEGYAIFCGPLKVAILTTRHNQGLVKNGIPIMEAMERSSWSLHFTSPSMRVELIAAILAALPTEA